jgi:hypothetical protein
MQRWRMSDDWLFVMKMLNPTGGVPYSLRVSPEERDVTVCETEVSDLRQILEEWLPYRRDILGDGSLDYALHGGLGRVRSTRWMCKMP